MVWIKKNYIFSKLILNFSKNLPPSSCSYSRIGKLSTHESWAHQNTYKVTEEVFKDDIYMGESFRITE